MEKEFLTFYKSLEKNTFKMFYKNNFYFVYEDDLEQLTKNAINLFGCTMTPTRKESILELKITKQQGELLIKYFLTEKKLSVQEYIFLNNDFILNREGHPGNWKDFNEILISTEQTPYMGAVYQINKNTISFSFIDSLDKTIFYFTFQDDDILTNLFNFISEINISEIICCQNSILRNLNNMGITVNLVNPKGETNISPSASILIDFLKLKTYKLKEYFPESIMRVDNSLLYALNIYSLENKLLSKEFLNQQTNFDYKNYVEHNFKDIFSTFYCQTNQGSRLLHKFFKFPLRDLNEINKRLDYVEIFTKLNLNLKYFPDLLRISKRIENERISLQECLRLYQIIFKIPELLQSLIKYEILYQDFIFPLESLKEIFYDLIKEIERVIDLEKANNNEYCIRANLSCNLEKLQNDIFKIKNEIKLEYERVLTLNKKIKLEFSGTLKPSDILNSKSSTVCDDEIENIYFNKDINIAPKSEMGFEEYNSYKSTKNISIKDIHFSFKLSRIDFRSFQNEFKKNRFFEISFLKSGIIFTSKKLYELNLNWDKIIKEISKEERTIKKELKSFLKNYISHIEIFNHVIAMIDVFSAFALKSKLNYSRPIFKENYFEIRKVFNPLLENNECVLNSFKLEDRKICVITGPNMGGKSTFLKSCGIVSLFAQMGCYVPCEFACIPIFDGIFCRIGANDCTFKGLSTFMIEMIDISKICKSATSKSLVLIDELGRGTSAIDGLSIALSVSDYLWNLKCFSIFATHFPELCTEKVVSKRVKVHKESRDIVLTYELEDGVCDTSLGLFVADLVGFPQEVLNLKD
ncbi:DNA mismatch repair protein Msh2 [Hamiltosporidium tvaerminnensis]|uniref:DNA mismatch repair protein Msh2 n=1 Tax=Hamiltosporidium tvaerminnensis TaxID=1176355 RepID=A0A4Q9L3J5_9MICR|nr:DNA mismatch repair protein Msh2 [Hamiltosporidium tvaerminnensis]